MVKWLSRVGKNRLNGSEINAQFWESKICLLPILSKLLIIFNIKTAMFGTYKPHTFL